MSARELGELAGYHQVQVSDLERAKKKPSIDDVLTFARVFGVSFGDLTGIEC